MKEKNPKAVILSLIKDDLINNKLVHMLNDAGLNADNYLLHLSDTIFTLIGITDTLSNEFIYEKYIHLAKSART